MKKVILCILISTEVMIFLVALKVSADNIPSVVENDQQAKIMLDRALQLLKDKLGMTFSSPFEVILTTGQRS